MNEDSRGIILGMVFGDGHLTKPGGMTSTLVVKHCYKQKPYAEYKATLITNALGGLRPVVKDINNSGFPGCLFQKTDPYFRVLRDWIYKDGKKTLSPYIRWLTPEGLAIWYMDDGGLGRKYRRGKIHAVDLYINCHTDFDEAKKIAAEIEKRFGIVFRLDLNNRSYRLRCGTKEARKFAPIVAPFMHGSMMYKLAIPEKPTSARQPKNGLMI